MLTQGSSELWNCILFGLTILHHSSLYKLYVCLWKLAVWKISSFYFYMYLKNLYILLFFNPAMLLFWQPFMESKWAKHVCQISWKFSLQFFTIIITEKKQNINMCPDNIFTGCEVIVHLSFPDIHVQNCNT